MFHALPPSALDEAKRVLARHALGPAPLATIAGLMDLGGGVAFRVVSEELDAIREAIGDHFHGLLSAQDAGGWRPHVTIQNKVTPRAAKALMDELARDFHPRPLGVAGLSLQHYVGGSWETATVHKFRG